MDTVHLSDGGRWYKTRKPKLQIDILGYLVLNGKLSKGKAEKILKKRHGDIISSFDKLEDNGFIKQNGKIEGRGKIQTVYIITEAGLRLLIDDESTDSLAFWKALFGYCHHSDRPIDSKVTDSLIQSFLQKHMKYRTVRYLLLSDIFDNTIQKWLKDFVENNDKITNEQKILEILALNRGATLEQLVKSTNASELEISRVLSLYTLNSYEPEERKEFYTHQNIIGKKYNKKYWEFLLHCLVKNYEDKASKNMRYELSLFGIIMVFTIIRLNNRNKLIHGLFYKDISFCDYFEMVISNYKDILPLIFGKWTLLKNTLNLYSLYNFDIILDKDLRQNESNEISVLRGGNKELVDGFKELVLQNRKQLGEFVNDGNYIFRNYAYNVPYYVYNDNKDKNYLTENSISKDKPNVNKIKILIFMLEEGNFVLNPVETVFNESSVYKGKMDEVARIQESMFESEITFLYYSNLYFEHGFSSRFSEPFDNSSSKVDTPDSMYNYQIPKDCLTSILESDKQNPVIGNWLSSIISDIHSYYKDIDDFFKKG